MYETLVTHLEEVVNVLLTTPINLGEKFYFVYVLTFVGLAYLSYYLYYSKDYPRFFRFVFPSRIYWHPSARIDYGIYLINLVLSPLFLISAGLQAYVSVLIGDWLVQLNGGEAVVVGTWSTSVYAAFIVGYTLVADLSVYLIHRVHHAVPVLWPFHALHHSAEVLTPVTLFRKHPLWNLSARGLNLTLTGAFQGVFLFVFFGNPGMEILFGLNTLYVVYNFFGANLRHSHIWLSWGKTLSHVFISPAMHQIHHDPSRMNRNYGEIFALWDWWFGTLYIPERREEFSIGLGPETKNPHATLLRAYYMPFVEAGNELLRLLRTSDSTRRRE